MNRFVNSRAVQGGQQTPIERNGTPPLSQAGAVVREERALAQSLKIKTSGNMALAAAHMPNRFSGQNGFSNTQYQQGHGIEETQRETPYQQGGYGIDQTQRETPYQQAGYGIDETQRDTQHHRDILEDTTVASDFDRTKSDIGFEPQHQGYDEVIDDRFDGQVYMPPERRPYVDHASSKEPHIIQHKQSRSPLVNTKPETVPRRQQSLAPAGRFDAKKLHQDLQLRNGHDQESRKRSRSRDLPRAPVSRAQIEESDSPGEEDDADDLEFPYGPPDATVRLDRKQISNHISSDTEGASPSRRHKPQNFPQPQSPQNLAEVEDEDEAEKGTLDDRLVPDYTTEELKRMKYSDLESEGWDMVPHAKPFELPNELQGRKVTLEKKVTYYATKVSEQVDQVPFYESLTTEEWEQAGDLLMDKFGELMKRLKAKKREKREAAEGFEGEIKTREEAVRTEAGKIDKCLEGMEITGKSLLPQTPRRSHR